MREISGAFSKPRAGRRGSARVESVERRLLLTTYVVTTTADSGEGSLRDAILQTEDDSSPDVIDFNIGEGGVQSIQPLSPLPGIFNTVTLDGTTQPGYSGTPLIVIDGKNSGSTTGPGLFVGSGGDGSVIRGLAVVDSTGAGIAIRGADDVGLFSDEVGIIPGVDGQAGSIASNGGYGIDVAFSSGDQIGSSGFGNTIGGNAQGGISVNGQASGISVSAVSTTPAGTRIEGNSIGALNVPDSQIGLGSQSYGNRGDGINLTDSVAASILGNLISGNAGDGVQIVSGSGNLVEGNLIGTSSTGLRAVPNSLDGVAVDDSPGNTIGGHATGQGNLISGNVGDGVLVDQAGATANLIQGNTIGLDLLGASQVANSGDGIHLLGAPANTIGGTAPGSSNLVAANGGDGVLVQGLGSSGTLVQGNQVVGNSGEGVAIFDAASNALIFNLIGQNRLDGIAILDASASGNAILGNLIGTDAEGSQLGNTEDGIYLLNSANNTIGGASSGLRNVISNNANNGISLRGPGASGNLVEGDYIGLDPTGTLNLGNLLDGVAIINAPSNTIGGTAPGDRNVISRNRSGVDILSVTDAEAGPSAADLHGGLADGNLVLGNDIGTDATGENDLGNFQDGVVITDGSDNTVGGITPGSTNVISNNLADGVGIGLSGNGTDPTSGNLIQGNIIGLDQSATLRLGNGQDGVRLVIAADATIGGTVPGSGNVISGNNNGIGVIGLPGADLGDLIQGNVIGLGGDGEQLDTTAAGLLSLRNTGNGIQLEQGAAGVTIGGTILAAGNEISGNGSAGVRFLTSSAHDLVEGNRIGVSNDGLTARANNESGIFIADQSTGITIGGTAAGSTNVISGNPTGVTITNPGTSGNFIQGNDIGLGLDGMTPVGNIGFGVLLLDGASGNLIGGATPSSRNLISANGQGVGIIGPYSSDNLIAGNIVGLDKTGTAPLGNLQVGVILLNGATDNTIGGTAGVAGNVISGNTGVGVEVFGPDSTRNLVVGNVVGLDATGSTGTSPSGLSLGNAGFGVQVLDAPNNTVGGAIAQARNVISNNRQGGVDVSGPGAVMTLVQGNFIGTDAGGRVALGNLADGVLVDGARLVVVGGVAPEARNLISGNAASGVEVAGLGSAGDLVLGNFVGTDAFGLQPLPNGQSGVYINAAPGVTVGGTTGAVANVISGNGQDGVRVAGASSNGSQVLGNFIGVDATGRAPLGNGNDGVLLDGAVGVTVGNLQPGSSNVISSNAASGVEFAGPATSFDALEANLIGTDATGTTGLPNATGVFVNGSPFNVIGGSAPGSSNLISGNSSFGVHLFGVNSGGNLVQGNRIGTDVSGSTSVPNQAGVFLDGAPGDDVADNVLSGNTSAGLIIQGTGASGDLVEGNLVGLDATGDRAINPANPQQSGVLIIDAPRDVVGGFTPSGRNVISGNLVGVDISGFNAQGDLIAGNFIGTDAFGQSSVSNQTGVYINGSPSNVVGGTAPGSGNLISGNTVGGVEIYGTLASGNVVEGNKIGTDFTGSRALSNPTGVYVELAVSNTIGGPTASAGNLISGNSVAGVYFYNQASGNLVQGNKIGVTAAGKRLGNGEYGVLLYNAANNTVDMSKATGNLIANSGIGNFREFTGAAPSTTTTTTTTKKPKAKAPPKATVKAKVAHPSGPKTLSHR